MRDVAMNMHPCDMCKGSEDLHSLLSKVRNAVERLGEHQLLEEHPGALYRLLGEPLLVGVVLELTEALRTTVDVCGGVRCERAGRQRAVRQRG